MTRVDVVQLLIAHGADVNAKSKNSVAPLDYASFQHDREAVAELLIRNGASVNAEHLNNSAAGGVPLGRVDSGEGD